jgi:hypothetical protein
MVKWQSGIEVIWENAVRFEYNKFIVSQQSNPVVNKGVENGIWWHNVIGGEELLNVPRVYVSPWFTVMLEKCCLWASGININICDNI